MRTEPKIGLLPFWLKLYDECLPGKVKEFEPFLKTVEKGLAKEGVSVARAEVCRVKSQFAKAVRDLEKQGIDLLVTLHLGYSPSLESLDAVRKAKVPICILDTTMDYDFGLTVGPDRIINDHGIHGVMDLASMLRRSGRPFHIVAGHVTKSDVLARAAGIAKAAAGAQALHTMKALRIGESFKGMGDFSVDEAVMKDVLGVQVKQISASVLKRAAKAVSARDLKGEMALDKKRFTVKAPKAVHERSVRIGLALRQYLDKGGYGAFSMNFLAFQSPDDTVPFLEISKAMARGLGYGGEGDVLTASLVGALSSAFGQTTFTEIFCPDWKGDSLFLSHMGEINPEVATGKPILLEKEFPFTPAQNPAFITCALKPGPAVFVNIVPGPNDTFSLIIAPVNVLGDTKNTKMKGAVRGWIQPDSGTIGEFLEEYSLNGGTHHSGLVLGDVTEALVAFAEFAGLEPVVI